MARLLFLFWATTAIINPALVPRRKGQKQHQVRLAEALFDLDPSLILDLFAKAKGLHIQLVCNVL